MPLQGAMEVCQSVVCASLPGASRLHRNFYTEKSLHRGTFAHRSFYTNILHRGVFTHRSFNTEKSLHKGNFDREVFTQKKLSHRVGFTQRSCYTHTEAFTHRIFCTEKSIQGNTCAQKLSRKETFTQFFFQQRELYTEELLHADAFTHKNFYTRKF